MQNPLVSIPQASAADVLIVGSGLIGALVAQRIRENLPDARITMVEGGSRIGPVDGHHLHDNADAEIRDAFNGRAAVGVQSVYVGPRFTSSVGTDIADLPPGMFSLSAFDDDTTTMPAAALSWNVGGMGVHWTAACPWPYDFEVVDFLPREEWDRDLAAARRLLHVTEAPFVPSAAGKRVLEVINGQLASDGQPSRRAQVMPMASIAGDDGTIARVGPDRIFPPLASGTDDRFELLDETLCVEILTNGSRATGARLRDVSTGDERDLSARAVIVCADPLRTPQLLWASGIRGEAVGAYLNEHAFLSGRVTVDLERLGLTPGDLPAYREDEPFTNVYWLPQCGTGQPLHGQIMEFLNPRAEDSRDLLYSIGASVYVPTQIRQENRIRFSQTQTDAAGLPRMELDFSYSPTDLANIERGRCLQRDLCTQLGEFDSDKDSLLLDAGSSMHYTGTVRMGESHDGRSVCDTNGRVWELENLFLGGGGVVPTALACNSTLTAALLAVRMTRAAVDYVSRVTSATPKTTGQ